MIPIGGWPPTVQEARTRLCRGLRPLQRRQVRGGALALRTMASLCSKPPYRLQHGEAPLTEEEFNRVRAAVTSSLHSSGRLVGSMRCACYSMQNRFRTKEYLPRYCLKPTEDALTLAAFLVDATIPLDNPRSVQVMGGSPALQASAAFVDRAISLVNLADIDHLDRFLIDVYYPETTSFETSQHGVHSILSCGRWTALTPLTHRASICGLPGFTYVPKVSSPQLQQLIALSNELLEQFMGPKGGDPLLFKGEVEDWLNANGYEVMGRAIYRSGGTAVPHLSASTLFGEAVHSTMNRRAIQDSLRQRWISNPPKLPTRREKRVPFWLDAATGASLGVSLLPHGTWVNAGGALSSAVLGIEGGSRAYHIAVAEEAYTRTLGGPYYVVLSVEDVALIQQLISIY